ncbi:hypothetical protein LguiA_020566 [Lonicera macranthoides]
MPKFVTFVSMVFVWWLCEGKERKDDEATSGNEIEKKRGDGWPMMGDGNDGQSWGL